METQKGPPTWLLVLQFIITVVVMALLIAGPGGWGDAGQRFRRFLQRPGEAAGGGPAPGRPSATSVPFDAPVIAAPLTPRRTVTPTPLPVSTAVVAPSVNVTPASGVAPSPRTAAPEQKGAAPSGPPSAARVTPPTLSPQQYFGKLMRDGYRLYQTGWYGPAMARFKEAARVTPGSASAQLWYGRAARRAGRPVEARAALERAIALAPGSDAARAARGLLDRMAQRPE